MQDLEARIRNAVDKIQRRDRQLADEMSSVRGSAGREQEARVLADRFEAPLECHPILPILGCKDGRVTQT